MFTLPFCAFFGVRHFFTKYYPLDTYLKNVWAVVASVIVCNIIMLGYAYQAYHEKEYDEDGNEIDPSSYNQEVVTAESRSGLNKKDD